LTSAPRSGPAFIAVGGGKGGVGKSFVAANLALALARRGAGRGDRVVAVDLDLGGSNLNLFLGESLPRREISDFLEGRLDTLNAVSQPTRLPALRFVAGSFDTMTAVDPLRAKKLDLIRALVGLEADIVVLDLPAGSAASTLDFFFLGDVKIVVTNPEAVAYHNAYGFLKNYLLRRLLTEFRDRADVMSSILDRYRALPGEEASTQPDRTITGLVSALRTEHPDVSGEIGGILEYDTPMLILNRVRRRGDRETLNRFKSVVDRNLGLRCQALGAIAEDSQVGAAVREGRPFLLAHPKHRIARQIEVWAERAGAIARWR
jgi:flagellar biosynthesis protein FlhG